VAAPRPLNGKAHVTNIRCGAGLSQTVLRLSTYSQSGRKIPEFPELSHREVIVPLYRFFYRVDEPTVWIVAVWHGMILVVLAVFLFGG
jgi:plasmid stabilization system protein ParE